MERVIIDAIEERKKRLSKKRRVHEMMFVVDMDYEYGALYIHFGDKNGTTYSFDTEALEKLGWTPPKGE